MISEGRPSTILREIARLRQFLKQGHFEQGQAILHQGAPNETFHIVISGQAGIYLEGEPRVKVAQIGPGGFFGEMTCLTGEPASATVEALEPVMTLALDKEGLLRFVDISEELRRRLIGALVERIRRGNLQVQSETQKSAALVEAISLDLADQAESLFEIRAELRRLAVLNTPVAVIGEPIATDNAALRIHLMSKYKDGPLLILNQINPNWELFEQQAKAAQNGTLVLRNAERMTQDLLLHMMLSVPQNTRLVLAGTAVPELPGIERVVLSGATPNA